MHLEKDKCFNLLDLRLTAPLGQRKGCVNFLPAGKAEQAGEEKQVRILLPPVAAILCLR